MSQRYAAMAEANWRRDAPDQVATLQDPATFFAELGAEAQRQVDTAMESSQAPEGETFAQRATRLSAVRQMAEEIVARELLTPPQPPIEDLDPVSGMPLPEPESPEDRDLREALTDFQDAATELAARTAPTS